VGLLSLPLERGDGEQMRQYSLVAEQVEVATEPVVDSQRRTGLVFCGAEAARAGRSRRSLSERDEAGKPAGAAANAQAALGPAGGAQTLQRSGRLHYCGVALQLVSAPVSPFRSPAPVSSDLGQVIVHSPVLAELAQFPQKLPRPRGGERPDRREDARLRERADVCLLQPGHAGLALLRRQRVPRSHGTKQRSGHLRELRDVYLEQVVTHCLGSDLQRAVTPGPAFDNPLGNGRMPRQSVQQRP
jgi:hypothetical protein